MADLQEYYKKRDFDKTAEPRGEVGKKSENRFCIQHHHASSMHYDLRIEHEGVLLSWAVPKGPSADPQTKRLAMQTEDHPVEYLTFEGTIPKGEYGAGKMIVWDLGTYEVPSEDDDADQQKLLAEGLKKGSFDVRFSGKKVQGLYKLVRTNKEKRQWLFFKKKDEHAGKRDFDPRSILSGREVDEVEEEDNPVAKVMKQGKPAPFPEDFKPMLAKPSPEVFSSKEWIYEVKYDGYRCLVFKKGSNVRLLSRNGNLLNKNYPDLVEAAKDLKPDGVFDAEIIVANETGGGDFQLLQQYLKAKKKEPLRLILFDLIYIEGRDLSAVPLYLRKAALQRVMEAVKNPLLKYSSHIEERGTEYFEAARKLKLEGIIGKKRDSIYSKNKRSSNWLKFKNILEEDLAIVGLTPSDERGRAFGAMLLGRTNAKGELQYAGKVGTGFSLQDTKDLKEQLEEYKTDKAPVDIKEKVLFWIKPHYLAQIRYTEKTREGKLRHPSFMALRDDKFYPGENGQSEIETKKPKKGSSVSKIKNTTSYPFQKQTDLSFSNLDKEYFPESGIVKGDIIGYYDKVADYILPHLKDRPLTLRRHPNGIKDDGFYQKNVEGEVPDFVETVKVYSKSDPDKEPITYAMCNNKETLLFMANWGCVEMHVMNSRKGNIDHPDHIVFDLDPIDNTLDELKEAATVLKEMLEKWDMPFGIKSSGSRGLHIYLPIENRYTHSQVRDMAHVVAKLWHRKLPDLTSLERMPAKRQKKVYLDYLQNGRSKTMATPYSLRVKKSAPVSLPLPWDELMKMEALSDYNLRNVPEILKEREDAWKELYANRIKLEDLVEKIEKVKV